MSDSSLTTVFTLAILGILILVGDWLFNVNFPEWLVWLPWAMLIINIVILLVAFGLIFQIVMAKERF